MEYQVTTASTLHHIEGIHTLQKKNLKSSLTLEEISSQGFVTCDHSISLLEEMGSEYPHIICLHENEVVGYALVMLPSMRDRIDILVSMFDMIDTLSYNNQELINTDYFVMGQVCIAKGHRSKGLFHRMYSQLKAEMKEDFDLCITEIATENLRSRKAHQKVGFEEIHTYIDKSSQISWELVGWNWA